MSNWIRRDLEMLFLSPPPHRQTRGGFPCWFSGPLLRTSQDSNIGWIKTRPWMPYFLLSFKMSLTLPAPVPLGLVWFGSEPCAHFLPFSCLAAGCAVGVGTGDTRHLLLPIRCLLCPACHSLSILHLWEAARASLLAAGLCLGGWGPLGL